MTYNNSRQFLSDKESEKYLPIINTYRSVNIKQLDFKNIMKSIDTIGIQEFRNIDMYLLANDKNTLLPLGGIVKINSKKITIKQDENNCLDYNFIDIIGNDPRPGGRKILVVIGYEPITNKLVTYVIRQRGKHVNNTVIKITIPTKSW